MKDHEDRIFSKFLHFLSLTIPDWVCRHQILWCQIVGLIKAVNMSHQPTLSDQG